MSNIDEVRDILAQMPYRPIEANTSNIVEIQALYAQRNGSDSQ